MPSDEEFTEGLRAALRAAIKRKGIKDKPLSVAAGLSSSAVRDIFQHISNPGVITLLRLAAVLDIPLWVLIYEAEQRAGHKKDG